MRYVSVLLAALFVAAFAFAQEGSEAGAEIETRTDRISKTLRCVVCQNQSIYDSDAPLAEDMRRLVRKRVEAGDSDAEVRSYLRQRYGDYVLMTPPFQSNTWLLWLGPIILLIAVGIWFVRRSRQNVLETSEPISAEARARVAAALAGDEGKQT